MQLNQVLRGPYWPPPSIRATWEEIDLYRAWRESDETRLRMEANVAQPLPYMMSPVPRLISRASANLLFSAAPIIRADAEVDQKNYDYIVDENDLPAELHRGALISSSEGEVWARIIIAPELLDAPIIEFVSRSRVIPEFRGRFIVGVTFITTWQTGTRLVYRLFETYERGSITAKLYAGQGDKLGTNVPLTSFEPTAGYSDRIETGIDSLLACFIPNTLDGNPQRGYSDYCGLHDRFLSLNEGGTIGASNLRLAGRKRAMIDSGYMKNGRLPHEDDVFIHTSKHGGDDAARITPLQLLEYHYQAQETVHWLDWMIDTTLSFSGTAPEILGRNVGQGIISGTALKLKMSHSLMESAGKGHYFDRQVPRLLRLAAQAHEKYFGATYSNTEALPSFQRKNGLPQDDMEAAQELNMWVGSESISLEERIEFLHPDWTPQQKTTEIKRIRDELAQQQQQGQNGQGFGGPTDFQNNMQRPPRVLPGT